MIRVPYLLTLLGLSVRASAASIEPALLGLDPWHEHLVLGTVDAHARRHAILHHTHGANREHLRSSVEPPTLGAGALVISIVDNVRAVLNTLAGSAAEALLAPQLWVPATFVSMTLALWAQATAPMAIASITPPTPPPRTIR